MMERETADELDLLFAEKQRQENEERELGLDLRREGLEQAAYLRSTRLMAKEDVESRIRASAACVELAAATADHNAWLRSDAHWLRVFAAGIAQSGYTGHDVAVRAKEIVDQIKTIEDVSGKERR